MTDIIKSAIIDAVDLGENLDAIGNKPCSHSY